MFQKILQWIREVLAKMINQQNVKTALGVDVLVSAPMVDALKLWADMYANQAYWLGKDIRSLNLPAAIASEIARAVTIEMDIEVDGSARADYLYEQIEKIEPKLRTMVEYGAAKGGLVFKPYVKGGEIAVDYVQADQFYPVSFDANGHITACVFSDTRTVGKRYYTRLEYHEMVAEGCRITNLAYVSDTADVLGKQVALSSIDDWTNIEPQTTITNIPRPLFAYFRYPSANNIDPTSPLGVSAYARAADLIRDADLQWSNFMWEFESGQRALYADTLAFDKGADGKPILPNKRLYRSLNQSGPIGSGDALFQEWTPNLREVSLLNGLDAILKRIEFNCGLAYGTLSNPNITAQTATEIKMQKQRSYATVTDTQKALEDALKDLLYAMDVLATLYKLAPAGKYETKFSFDDSIVADHDTQFTQDGVAVGMGVMSKIEFRMRNYGETPEQARIMVELATKEMGAGLIIPT